MFRLASRSQSASLTSSFSFAHRRQTTQHKHSTKKLGHSTVEQTRDAFVLDPALTQIGLLIGWRGEGGGGKVCLLLA